MEPRKVKKAADCARFRQAIALLTDRDAKKLEQAMNAELAAGKNEHRAFDAAWDKVMGY